MKLRSLGLKPKIGIGFGSLLAIIVGMGWTGYRSAVRNERIAADARLYSSMTDITRSLQQAILTKRIGERDILMGRDKEETHLYERGDSDFHHALDQLKPLLPTEEDRALFDNVVAANEEYSKRNQSVVELYRSGHADRAVEMFKSKDALAVADGVAAAMADMTAAFVRSRQDALDREVATDARSKALMLGLALWGLALGLAIAIVISRSIVQGIQEMLSMIETLAANRLAVEDMPVDTEDAMGNAAHGLNKMKNRLREVILSIASAAENVSTSSREISTTAAQAASSAENQKRQVHRIAAVMEEMAATVHGVSKHASAAAISATSAAANARDGGQIVEDVLGRMKGIAQSARDSAVKIEQLGARSDDIGRIVGVIDEIANQTSLLALNAAIEAARAGEQGCGFAVVASEVRRLAERTGTATKEIASVIQTVQTLTAEAVRQMRSGTTAVEQGVEATGAAGESIARIIREADHVGSMVAQIASAAAQQAAATEGVTGSMTRISSLAAESAHGAGESARACEQLSKLALGLQAMVDQFEAGQRVGKTTQPGAPLAENPLRGLLPGADQLEPVWQP